MDSWSLQDAKARFSELVRRVKAKGPHTVTLRGKPEIVIMTLKDYETLNSQRPSLMNLMKSSPLANMDLEVGRKGGNREIEI